METRNLPIIIDCWTALNGNQNDSKVVLRSENVQHELTSTAARYRCSVSLETIT